jgi:hypothetical protein
MRQRNKRKAPWLEAVIDDRDAVRRVGKWPRDRLRWLVNDFAARPNYGKLPAASTPGKIVIEVVAFIMLQGGAGASAMRLDRMPRMPPDKLQMLAKEVEDGLNRFLDGTGWEVLARAPVIRRVARGWPAGQWRLRWPLPASAASLRSLFVLCAQELLMQEGNALARCALEDCEAMFVKDDPRQRFCIPAHTAVDRMRRYRTKTRVSLDTAPESKPRRSRRQRLARSAKDRVRAI